MVEGHAGQRQGADDDQPAGGRQPADEGQQRQGFALCGEAEAEGEVFGVGADAQLKAGPEDQRHGQTHQQQVQRQSPAGADQPARVEVLGERHVIHVWHDDGRGEEHQQQGAPRAFLQWRVQRLQRRLVLQQPDLQLVRAAEDHVKGVQADGTEGHELDDGFEGDGEHQPFVLLPRGDVAGTEEDGEQHDHQAVAQRHALLQRLEGQDADGVGDRLDLQGQQRQHADQHDDGGQRAAPGAAEAEGHQVGQRRQLIGTSDPQDRVEQHRRQQKGAAHAEIGGEKPVAILVGQAHGAIEGPGAGVDAEREGVGQRVADDPARDQPAIADPGHAEQHEQVGGADQDQVAQAKARLHRAGSGE